MKLKDILALVRKYKWLAIPLVLLIIYIGYEYSQQVKDDYYTDDPNGLVQVDAIGDIPLRRTLNQGTAWDQSMREDFWYTSQGSGIIPYTWFVWLEQADSEELFRSADFIEKIGYLPSKSSKLNPGGLPIGFTAQRARKDKEPWMGFNCAACHTNQIDYKGTKMMIEGAPTLANFETVYNELVNSLVETVGNEEKFNRFKEKVLAEGASASDATKLKADMGKLIEKAQFRQRINKLPGSFPEDFAGHGRVDAFGQIVNAGSAQALGDEDNNNPPSAPVSYPFLWGTHQSDVVQWNASAPNIPIVGPLARNVGEVVGVFGDLTFEEAPWWQQVLNIPVAYSSTVDFEGIGNIEAWIKELKSPQWPEDILPPIDEEKKRLGRELFITECISCHDVIGRSKELEDYDAIKTPLYDVGTDPMMAFNAENGRANTLLLDGTKESVIIGKDFGAQSGAISIVSNGIIGVILKRPGKALDAGRAPESSDGDKKGFVGELLTELVNRRDAHKNEYKNPHDTLKAPNALGPNGPDLDLDSLVYKARPLNGIWATAPFLHNGSVPNMWELMQAPDQRVKTFHVGSREFDPVNVGFVTDVGPTVFKVMRPDNTTIQPGNSNLGHNYGTHLSDSDKWALIEYVKSL